MDEGLEEKDAEKLKQGGKEEAGSQDL